MGRTVELARMGGKRRNPPCSLSTVASSRGRVRRERARAQVTTTRTRHGAEEDREDEAGERPVGKQHQREDRDHHERPAERRGGACRTPALTGCDLAGDRLAERLSFLLKASGPPRAALHGCACCSVSWRARSARWRSQSSVLKDTTSSVSSAAPHGAPAHAERRVHAAGGTADEGLRVGPGLQLERWDRPAGANRDRAEPTGRPGGARPVRAPRSVPGGRASRPGLGAPRRSSRWNRERNFTGSPAGTRGGCGRSPSRGCGQSPRAR